MGELKICVGQLKIYDEFFERVPGTYPCLLLKEKSTRQSGFTADDQHLGTLK